MDSLSTAASSLPSNSVNIFLLKYFECIFQSQLLQVDGGVSFKKKSVKISTILPFRDASAHSVDYNKKRMSARKSLAFQDRGILEAIKTRDKIKVIL